MASPKLPPPSASCSRSATTGYADASSNPAPASLRHACFYRCAARFFCGARAFPPHAVGPRENLPRRPVALPAPIPHFALTKHPHYPPPGMRRLRNEKPAVGICVYGIFMCLECSGIHRGLGVHISFVRCASSLDPRASLTRGYILSKNAGPSKIVVHAPPYTRIFFGGPHVCLFSRVV